MNGIEHDMSYNPRIIQAHTSELAAMALNYTGNLLATASKRVKSTNFFSSKIDLNNILCLHLLGHIDSCIFNEWCM